MGLITRLNRSTLVEIKNRQLMFLFGSSDRFDSSASSLLFVPDISGYTRFVEQTEMQHSEHIISELLGILLDANELSMAVAEIEGDAVLFYQLERVPPVGQILRQARTMFLRFHNHLQRYERERVCQCGACRTANDLTLKIIVHAGPIGFVSIKNRRKPHGSDVIRVHRLLKNDLALREYLLLTDAFDPAALTNLGPEYAWATPTVAKTRYDGVGPVQFSYIPLAPLRTELLAASRVPLPPQSTNRLVRQEFIEQSPEAIHRILLDLSLRPQWNKHIKGIEYDPKQINRYDTLHVCLLDSGPISFKTLGPVSGTDQLVYGERELNTRLVRESSRYFILEPEGTGTRLWLEARYQHWPGAGWLVDPLYQRRLSKALEEEIELLKVYCESHSLTN